MGLLIARLAVVLTALSFLLQVKGSQVRTLAAAIARAQVGWVVVFLGALSNHPMFCRHVA